MFIQIEIFIYLFIFSFLKQVGSQQRIKGAEIINSVVKTCDLKKSSLKAQHKNEKMVVAFVGCCSPAGEPDGTVGFLFTKREVPIYCKNLKNKPIYLTHKHDLGPVGMIAKSWMENGKMMVAGVIHTDSLPAKIAGKGVKNGLLKGLSLGTIHGVLKNNSGKCTDILWREIVDCSVCEVGDLPGTHILTVAAKEAVQEVIKNIKSSSSAPNFSPYNFFYSDAADKELLDMRTKERTLNSELSIPAVNQGIFFFCFCTFWLRLMY